MYRVWRYRGGRDGHETLQQFMNFLGREKTEPEAEPVARGGGSEGTTVGQEGSTEQAKGVSSNEQRDEGGISKTTDERQGPNTYAGVIIFCIPIAAEIGRGDVDLNTLQVWRM